jgi:hypothetical protein
MGPGTRHSTLLPDRCMGEADPGHAGAEHALGGRQPAGVRQSQTRSPSYTQSAAAAFTPAAATARRQ